MQCSQDAWGTFSAMADFGLFKETYPKYGNTAILLDDELLLDIHWWTFSKAKDLEEGEFKMPHSALVKNISSEQFFQAIQAKIFEGT